jgi:hypothetical protein
MKQRILLMFIAGFEILGTAQARLTGYDRLVPIEVAVGVDAEPAREKMKAFIWEHWISRSRGMFKATFFSKEGERIVTEGILGKDPRDVWKMSVTTLPQFSDPSSYSVYSIEQRRAERFSGVRLVFKDKNGRAITEW